MSWAFNATFHDIFVGKSWAQQSQSTTSRILCICVTATETELNQGLGERSDSKIPQRGNQQTNIFSLFNTTITTGKDPAVRQACTLSSREGSPYTMCLCTTGQQMNPSSVPQVYKGLDVPSPEVFHTQGSFQFPVLPQKGLFTDWGTDCDLQWGLFRAGLKITALGRVHLGSAWGTWSLDCSLSGNSQYSLWHFEIMFTLVTEFLLHPSPFKRYFTLFLAPSI